MASELKTDRVKQSEKDEEESGLSVLWWWIMKTLGKALSKPLPPLALMGLTVPLLIRSGEEQLVGAGLGTGHQALLHPCPSGAAGASRCWAAVILWLPEQPWETHRNPQIPYLHVQSRAFCKRQAEEDLWIVPSMKDAKAALMKAL